MRGISVLFLLLHFYWFCYGWFDMHGCTLGVLDRLLRNVQRTTGLFTYSYLTKLFAAGFLALSCWGTRSVRSERITHRQILLAAAAGLLLFFFGDPLRHLPPQWAAPLYVAATSIGFLSLFLAGLWLGRLVKERLREDPSRRKRKFHAGNTPDRERIFGQPPFALLLRQGMARRLDQAVNPFVRQ